MSASLAATAAAPPRASRAAPGLLLLGLLLLAWIFLPWIHQPERGTTLARTLAAERSANELGIQRQGLSLPPIAAVVTMGLALWGMLSPRHARALALVTLLAGLLGLVYHITFFLELGETGGAGLLAQMGSAFWLTLLAGLLLAAQFALPRQVTPGFEISKVLGNQESVLALGILTLVILVGVLNPRYVADRNISEILQGNAYIAVAAIGVSMVIMSGNIDISVGSLIGVLGIISGAMVVAGYPVWLSWLTPLVLGALVGAFIGFLVAWLRIPSIIVTLGMLSILRGGLLIFTNAEWITGMPAEYALSQQRPLGIPMGVYIMLALTLLAAWWLRNSPTGRAIYAVGGNAEAARLSGISVRRTIMTVFIINGVFADITLVDIPKLIGIGYFAATTKGQQEAAEELGNVSVTPDAPTEANIDDQITFIENYITRGVDGILFAANDPVAIAPVLSRALEEGIHVVGYDANSEPDAREWFVNQAEFNGIGKAMMDALAEEKGEDASFGIVTSTFTTPNQARWISEMWAYAGECYPEMEWLEMVEAQEDAILSFNQASTLINKYGDNLDALFGMTSVATPQSAEAVTQAGLCGEVAVVGLATPNAMRPYVQADCVKSVVLWNPVDLGYTSVYVMRAVVDGELKPGDSSVSAGRLGDLQVVNGSEILLGPPFIFNSENVEEFDF